MTGAGTDERRDEFSRARLAWLDALQTEMMDSSLIIDINNLGGAERRVPCLSGFTSVALTMGITVKSVIVLEFYNL